MTIPKKQQLNKAAQAMRNIASSELNDNMGKFKTGAHKNPGEKRARTRSAAVQKAIKEQE
jgi:hypothetical protein